MVVTLPSNSLDVITGVIIPFSSAVIVISNICALVPALLGSNWSNFFLPNASILAFSDVTARPLPSWSTCSAILASDCIAPPNVVLACSCCACLRRSWCSFLDFCSCSLAFLILSFHSSVFLLRFLAALSSSLAFFLAILSSFLRTSIPLNLEVSTNVGIDAINDCGLPSSSASFVNEEDFFFALEEILHMENINIKGLMTIGPLGNDESEIRKSFSFLRSLRDQVIIKFPEAGITDLSMGMSGDYEIAVEEGSTLIRVGTSLFGARNYK